MQIKQKEPKKKKKNNLNHCTQLPMHVEPDQVFDAAGPDYPRRERKVINVRKTRGKKNACWPLKMDWVENKESIIYL